MTTKELKSYNKKEKSNRISKSKRNSSHQVILKVFCKSTIVKPLNGSRGSSKGSYMLKLAPVIYTYLNKQNKVEESTINTYFLKGIRGALRHKVMDLCQEAGLEVCHSSDKKEDKNKNPLIPSGFHPLGFCAKNGGSCIVHEIFGGKTKQSIIAIISDPLVSMNVEKSATFPEPVQLVHISTEHRNAMAFEGTPLQDFSESYFSGHFSFEVDVTPCNEAQLGLLIKAAYHLERLGRGFNAGYGHLKVGKIQLLKRQLKRSLVLQGDSYIVKEEVVEEPLISEVVDALAAWDSYLESLSCN